MLLTTKIARFAGPTYARFARVVVPIAVRAAHTINVNITFDPTRPSEKLQITGLDTENVVVNRLDQHNTPDQTVTGGKAVSIDILLSLDNEQICKLLEQQKLPELAQFVRENKLTGNTFLRNSINETTYYLCTHLHRYKPRVRSRECSRLD